MRSIRWLHISDLHLRESEAWSQDAVLSSLLEDIRCRITDGASIDFVLATGDLAFSGHDAQYALVEAFFDDLADTLALQREKIFCIPGNHDVDRSRYKTTFIGARTTLKSQADIYSFLSVKEERETLLTRQHSYRAFRDRYFIGQARTYTNDGLAYVSTVEIDEIELAIVGLNSAWLAEGGEADHGRLLLGEHQVTKAIELARNTDPHVVIGMAHHPFVVISEFDRSATQHRLEDACHFFHCGHLHVPNASTAVVHTGRCLTLAAGASFESRDSHNAYTMVTLDPLHACADVKFVQYDPTNGAFSYQSDHTFDHQVDAVAACGIREMAEALSTYCPAVEEYCYFLAALLTESISDVPLSAGESVVFGALSVLRGQPQTELQTATLEFLSLVNAVKLLYGRKQLDEILATNGEPVAHYGTVLIALCDQNTDFSIQLAERNEFARKLAGADATKPFSHTLSLLHELHDAGDWEDLRSQAERHIDADAPQVAAEAMRMLALCCARSPETSERGRAKSLFQQLAELPQCRATDLAFLATLLNDDGESEPAKAIILEGIGKFPDNIEGFIEVGMTIVEATGDKDFRDQLTARRAERKAG